MSDNEYIKKYNIFFEYQPQITYDDFLKTDLSELHALSKQTVIIREGDGSKLVDNTYLEHIAFNNILGLDPLSSDEYHFTYKAKDYIALKIIDGIIGFGLPVHYIKRVFALLQYDVEDVYYYTEEERGLDGEMIFNVLTRNIKSDSLIARTNTVGAFEYLKYKYTKDPIVKDSLKVGVDLFTKGGKNPILRLASKFMRYKYRVTPNSILEYIVFNVLFLDEQLYLCLYKNTDVFLINDKVLKNILKDPILVVDLNVVVKSLFNSRIDENLKSKLKSKYCQDDTLATIDGFFEEIKEQFSKMGNIEIAVSSKEYDLNKWQDIENHLPKADLGRKKHKGIKKQITVERRFKLKKK